MFSGFAQVSFVPFDGIFVGLSLAASPRNLRFESSLKLSQYQVLKEEMGSGELYCRCVSVTVYFSLLKFLCLQVMDAY